MKILEINCEYYFYPPEISKLEDFIELANSNYNRFIKMTHLETENCVFPYFVAEDQKTVYLNMWAMTTVNEVEVNVLPRTEYDAKLERVVSEKCINCEYYEEEHCGDTLAGHREMISLDGVCFRYSEK